MTESYGVWWFKMAIIYHRKSFVTDPKSWRHYVKAGFKMFWLDVKKTRLRVKLYRLTDVEYYHLPRTEEPKHESYK